LRDSSLVDRAEHLAGEGRYAEAIDTYRKHIQVRLDETTRPEWENPDFYLLMIVDLQLKMAQAKEALRTCAEAEQRGVEPTLISDRYRAIAAWYEERGDLVAAFNLLKSHRGRDPLLFDAMLDRIGREITIRENSVGGR
jgi:tetratricopeptide (TPR) repeat protein